jgi:hypothetical protein
MTYNIKVSAVPDMKEPKTCGTAIVNKWKKQIRETIIDVFSGSTHYSNCSLRTDIKFDGDFVMFIIDFTGKDNTSELDNVVNYLINDFNCNNGFLFAHTDVHLNYKETS